LLPLSAEERVKKIKKAIRGKDNYSPYAEHRMMMEYSISYNELLDFPYIKYLEFSKILTQEKKHEKKQQERQQKEMEKKT